MDYPVNRPSVIVFHQSRVDNNSDVEIIHDSLIDGDNINNIDLTDSDVEIIPDPLFDDNENNNEVEQDNIDEDYWGDNEINNNEINDSGVPVEEYYTLQKQKYSRTRLAGILYLDVDAVINPEVYKHVNSTDFTATFRQLFHSIFDSIVEGVENKFPGEYNYVKVSVKCEGFSSPANYNFVSIRDFTSTFFETILYNLIQSQRDVITQNTLTIGFKFLKEKLPEKRKR
jgi:hypothetical protein